MSSVPPARGPGGTFLLGGQDADQVTLDIDSAAAQYVVTDAAGIIAGSDCTSVSAQTARCPKYPSAGEYFRARLRGGDDTFQMLSPGAKGAWVSWAAVEPTSS